MRTFDLTPLYRSAIGFDRLANLLEQRGEPSYPPYNIELVREVPEALKPRKIAIADALGNTGNVQALEQRDAA